MKLINKRVWLLGLVVIVFFVLQPPQKSSSLSAKANAQFSLKPPTFVRTAHAAVPKYIGEKLDEEAGISAYYHAPSSIDLDLIRDEFCTIEDETVDYLIGSVPVQNYVDTEGSGNTNQSNEFSFELKEPNFIFLPSIIR